MKKVIVSLISVLCLVFLVSCGSSSKKNERPATTADNALMYTFSVDKEEFRFRLLDGWIKYSTKDESIQLVKRIFEEWQIPIIFVTHSNYEAEALAHEVINID